AVARGDEATLDGEADGAPELRGVVGVATPDIVEEARPLVGLDDRDRRLGPGELLGSGGPAGTGEDHDTVARDVDVPAGDGVRVRSGGVVEPGLDVLQVGDAELHQTRLGAGGPDRVEVRAIGGRDGQARPVRAD